MTWILDFIHARKWLVELLLLGVIAGGIWWFCHHLIEVGVQRERSAWMLKVDAANLKAAEARGRAKAAEETGLREHNELTQYVADHPLHGPLASLCRKPPSVSSPTSSDSGHADPGSGAHDVLEVSAGDPGSDQDEPDQLGMLSLLGKRGDSVAGQLREYQSR